MPSSTSLQPGQSLDELRREAQRQPVEILHDGRRDVVLMSADHYDWLRAAAQRTHLTRSAPPVVIQAVERSEMDPEHTALDVLLD